MIWEQGEFPQNAKDCIARRQKKGRRGCRAWSSMLWPLGIKPGLLILFFHIMYTFHFKIFFILYSHQFFILEKLKFRFLCPFLYSPDNNNNFFLF